MPQKRIRSGKTRWVGRYRDPAGRERSRTFDTRREAAAWEAEREREMRRGEWIDPDDASVPLRALVQEWIDTATNPETVETRKSLMISLGPLADMPVHSIRASHIRTWRAKLVQGRDWLPAPKPGQKDRRALSESTAANTLGQLMTVLKLAREDGLIRSVPVVRGRKSAASRAVSRAELLTVDVVRAVATAAETGTARMPEGRPWLRAMILVAAGTGLRISELCALKVSDVDFLRREVHVSRQVGKGCVERPPKSAAGVRTVPVAQWVLDVLAAWLRDNPAGPVGWVWVRGDGRPHDRSSANYALQSTVRREGARKVQWHDFRHFYASALIAGGASPTDVQQVLGHSSVAVTMEVYMHLWPGSSDRIRGAAEVLGGVRDQCGTGAKKSPGQAG